MIKVSIEFTNGKTEIFFVKNYSCCGVAPPGYHFFFAEDKERIYDQRTILSAVYEDVD